MAQQSSGLVRRTAKSRKKTNTFKASISYELLQQMFIYLMYCRPIDQGIVSLISRMFEVLDKECFTAFEDREAIAEMIKICLRMIIEEKIDDKNLIIDALTAEQPEKFRSSPQNSFENILTSIDTEVSNTPELTEEDVKNYVRQRVTNILQYETIFRNKDALSELTQKMNDGDAVNLRETSSKFTEIASKIISNNNSIVASSGSQRSFIFGSENYKESLKQTITELKRPSNTIKTGIRLFNKMLSGGFKTGRHYVFLGAPGTGKSVMLNNVYYWAQRFNKDIVARNSSKTPLVIYISQENTKEETEERNFSMYAPKDVVSEHEMADFEPDQILDMYKSTGMLDCNVKFAFEYFENREISTIDLDGIVDKYELQGYEVIMVVHDYIKRIRGAEETGDQYVDFGNIVNEEKNFAVRRKLAFVTVMQINREGIVKLEEVVKSGKNLEKVASPSMMGNSLAIYENTDGCFVLTPNYDGDERYMCICKLKLRYQKKNSKNSNVTFLAIPFDGDSIALETDVGRTESRVRESWGDNIAGVDPSETVGKRKPVVPSRRGATAA